MASCKVVDEPRYEISLSKYEAQVLLKIGRSIGGDPDGPRGVMCSIIQCLEGCGLNPLKAETEGSLYFKDINK